MLQGLRYLLMAALFCGAVPVMAQVQFSIRTGASEIGRKDELQVQYVITGSNEVMHFEPPQFTNWQLLAGPVIDDAYIIENGKKKVTVTYTYFLSPTTTGKLTIPTTSVEADNKILHCAEVKVNVLKKDHVAGINPVTTPPVDMHFDDDAAAEETLQPGEDALKKIRNNLFVKAFATRRKVYVGEPVMVEYKLFSRVRASSRVIRQPSFTNCSVADITTDVLVSKEMLNGKTFTCKLFRKVQLVPLQPGRIDVGTTTLENQVTFVTGGADLRDLYYDRTTENTHTVNISSEPASIEVVPVPVNATRLPVGSFSFSARLKKRSHAMNETNTIVLTISGSGNFSPIHEPEVNWPAHIYHFDATETDTIDKHQFPFSGSRIYEIPYEADTTGNITIPAFSFSYFDPSKGVIQTISTQPMVAEVTKAVSTPKDDAPHVAASGRMVYVWCILTMLLVAGSWILFRRRKKQPTPVIIGETTVTTPTETTPLFDAAEAFNNLLLVQGDAAFYHEASALATAVLQSGKGDTALLEKIVADCKTMLYTPIPVTSKKEIIDQLRNAIA